MTVKVQMQLHRQTDRAVFASATGEVADAVWLPLSLVEVRAREGGTCDIDMPEWLATREGLV